jgi:hypothetical protein
MQSSCMGQALRLLSEPGRMFGRNVVKWLTDSRSGPLRLCRRSLDRVRYLLLLVFVSRRTLERKPPSETLVRQAPLSFRLLAGRVESG